MAAEEPRLQPSRSNDVTRRSEVKLAGVASASHCASFLPHIPTDAASHNHLERNERRVFTCMNKTLKKRGGNQRPRLQSYPACRCYSDTPRLSCAPRPRVPSLPRPCCAQRSKTRPWLAAPSTTLSPLPKP